MTKSQFEALKRKLKKDGQLTPSGILAEAKKKASPLHSLFEWRDGKAAEEYRLWQARKIIKKMNIKIEQPEEKMVHVPVKNGEGAYKTAKTVVENISEFEAAMDEATKRLRSAQSAVDALQDVANEHEPDKAAMIGVALQSIQAAQVAIERVH